jgi:hypothetical protein
MSDEERGDSLGRALGDIRRGASRARPPTSAAAKGKPGLHQGLDRILADEFRGEARDAARHGASEPPARTPDVAELARARRAPAAQPATSWPARPVVVTVIASLLLIAALFVQRHETTPVPEDASFRMQVERLGRAVDDYKSAHGQLPASLSQLPQFPANGIELSFRSYRLRLLADQPEFFFAPAAVGGFMLVGRYRGEVWMYTEASRRPLRRLGPVGV